MAIQRSLSRILSIIVVLTILFSGFHLPAAAAQGKDGIKRQVNAQTGKVSFIGPESGRVVPAAKALGTSPGFRPADPAMALAKRFGPEFGLKNPARDLKEQKTKRSDSGRMTVRYQQHYQGIPVMGAELVVNTNENGDLYSMNGEVLGDLSLSIRPTVNPEQARQAALQGAAKWYQKAPDDFISSEPELWIFDESLLRPSARLAELVWRMEVTAKDTILPVRELVLINAARGNISLHFNQIDTAWGGAEKEEMLAVPSTTQEHPKSSSVRSTADSTMNDVVAQSGTTWYVATTGNDSNSCFSPAVPCATINGAIAKAGIGETIKISVGTYTGTGAQVVLINKNVTLSGGWNNAFSTQDGSTAIDGQGVRQGVIINYAVTAFIDHLTIQNGFHSMQGGGIHSYGNLTVDNSLIKNNLSGWMGGGIHNLYGTLTVNDTTISENKAGKTSTGGGGGGGGIYSSRGFVTLNNTTVSNNTILGQYSGSGIYNSGDLVLNNSTVSGNTGAEGIYHNGGTMTLNNSTVTQNVGPIIGGITNSSAQVIFQNSIVAGNIGTTAPDCNKASSVGYNLIGINTFTFVGGLTRNEVITGSCITPNSGDLVGTSAAPIHPRLTPLQDNGGPTFTHALITGSPAINSGNPATPSSGGNACLAADQRGITRPVAERCDIGAYEGSVSWVTVSTYTAGNTSSLPGTFLCDQSTPICTNGNNPHAEAAHKYAIGIHNFYLAQFNRDSMDSRGMTVISTVQYCDPDLPCPYDNAHWNGEQMVFGGRYGLPLADDIVAHEFTHGVTQYESNLFYYYQSGAINESLSDLWGEYYDQTNGQGTDTSGVKWQIGEDVSGLGTFRSMSNPTQFGDPDKMSSPSYFLGPEDNGGVHYNSGVNNKAVYLMVDGGSFNGKTISALGWEKTGAIYYEANTNLLTSGADYSDLYYTLQQACSNLIGQKGITDGDCAEVKDALDAVEMDGQPAPNFNTDAPYCNHGTLGTVIFFDDLESGEGNWTFSNGAHTRWQYDSPYGSYARSGEHFLYADDDPASVADASARLKPISIPSDAYLHFAHAYEFETDSPDYYDGGVLEYSVDGGSNWVDAGLLIEHNGYQGALFTGASNPLSGKSAFVSTSHGYISTRVNLTSLAGKTVLFRWRMGLDESVAVGGWWLDDVKIYQCIPDTKGAGIYDDSEWTYNSNWKTLGVAGAYNASIHYSSGVNDWATFHFEGSGFDLIYTVASDRGQMDVFVDDEYVGTINAYNPSMVYQTRWSKRVTPGTHTVKVVHRSGDYVDIDAIQIPSSSGSSTPGEGTYDGTDPNWAYSPNWKMLNAAGAYGDSIHYSSAVNDWATFRFDGSSFDLIYTIASDRGQMDVFVDDVYTGTINAYNSSMVFQTRWSKALTPGTHTVKVVHKSGAYVDIDAIQIPSSGGSSTPGEGTYDGTDPNWVYSLNWKTLNIAGAYGGSIHYSSALNDWATFRFEGSSFDLIYTVASDRGEMDVFVDDVYTGTINAYNPTMIFQTRWSKEVTSGMHRVKVVHKSGAYVDIDAIQIPSSGGSSTPGEGTYDGTDPNWAYSPNWKMLGVAGAYGGSIHYSAAVNDWATFRFEGSGFDLIYTLASDRGQMDVFVDDVYAGTINAYNASMVYQTRWAKALTPGTHTVKVVHKSGAYVDIDGIEILSSDAPGEGVYDDSNWVYNSNWKRLSVPGAYGGSIHYSSAVNDWATFRFEGSSFDLIYTVASDRGEMDVFVDDVYVDTINAYNPTMVFQTRWTRAVTAGTHTVKVVHKSGAYVDLDAIEITP